MTSKCNNTMFCRFNVERKSARQRQKPEFQPFTLGREIQIEIGDRSCLCCFAGVNIAYKYFYMYQYMCVYIRMHNLCLFK